MSFEADLSDAVSRVRFIVGDFGDVERLEDETYTAAIAAASGDESAAAAAIAGALLTTQPVRISDQGTTIDDSALHARWRIIVETQARSRGAIRSRLAERGDRQPLAEYRRETRW